MSSKRKDAPSDEKSGRDKKKQRIADARTIAFQLPSSSSSPAPGTARVGLAGGPLPSALDVEKFAQARAFEITAMQTTMQTSKESSTSRAWQELPRHLRRRAASHDVRRVPLRLRDKARAEMDPVTKKAPKRQIPKQGLSKKISRSASFSRRQRDKTWLETHLWHAKRMKMQDIWGYRLAMEPTEKAQRPSFRAAVHGSILHDASYLGLIEMKGPEATILAALYQCCELSGPLVYFLSGARARRTHIYEPGQYPLGLICPVTMLWKPTEPKATASASKSPKGKGKQKEKKSKKATSKPTSDAPIEPGRRTLWIQCHPGSFARVVSALHSATSQVLNDLQRSSTSPVEGVEIADLRSKVNVFEITGPRSSQVLHGALHPVTGNDDFKRFWGSLKNLQSSGSVVSNMVVGFTVHDPRLSFPPKNSSASQGDSSYSGATSSLARGDIWSAVTSEKYQGPRYKKKELDERRAKNLVPGTRLTPTTNDDRVPALLIQQSTEGMSNSQGMYGWTLMVPAGWGMAFLSSLLFTGTRVAGQKQKLQQAFETGSPAFPYHYPSTVEYEEMATAQAEEEEDRWERTPMSKRPNFESLGIQQPWQADWHGLLGVEQPFVPEPEEDLIPAQRNSHEVPAEETPAEGDNEMQMETDEEKDFSTPWLCPDALVISLLKSNESSNPSLVLASKINALRLQQKIKPIQVDSQSLLDCALVRVCMTLCGRGAPHDLGMIYVLEDEELKVWWEMHRKHGRIGLPAPIAGDAMDEEGDGDELPLEQKFSRYAPIEGSLIGRIISGGFSLSRGKGFAIGCVPLVKLLHLKQQSTRLLTPCLVKLRDRDGQVCRLASLEY